MGAEKKQAMIVINPYAGKQRAVRELFTILDTLYEHGYLAAVYPTRGRNDATELVVEHAAAYDLLVCCGGDGTLHEVIEGVLRLDDAPPLGYIPAGTTNDLAKSLGLSCDVATAARQLVSGRLVSIDVGVFNRDRHFTYIAAFGALTEVSYCTPQKWKQLFGHAAYIMSCLKTFVKGAFGLMPCYHARFEFNGQVVEDDFVICAIANSTSVGGVFQLSASQVEFDDGLFELVLVRYSRNPFVLLAKVIRMMRQQYDGVEARLVKTDRVKVTAPEGLDWCLDGEFGGRLTEAEIGVKPRCVRFVVGE